MPTRSSQPCCCVTRHNWNDPCRYRTISRFELFPAAGPLAGAHLSGGQELIVLIRECLAPVAGSGATIDSLHACVLRHTNPLAYGRKRSAALTWSSCWRGLQRNCVCLTPDISGGGTKSILEIDLCFNRSRGFIMLSISPTDPGALCVNALSERLMGSSFVCDPTGSVIHLPCH